MSGNPILHFYTECIFISAFYHSSTAMLFPFLFTLFFRRIMLFIIALPVAQIIIFCLSIGKDPVGLKLAIVNNELNSSMQTCIPTIGCDWSLLSCRYLQHLEKKTINLLPHDNEDEARNAVKKGWAWGAITFPSNYSDALKARIDYGRNAEEWDVEFSEMLVVLDMSSKPLNIIHA